MNSEQFRQWYNKNHCCCPDCGNNKINTTLVDYFIKVAHNSSGNEYVTNVDTYKDKNRAICISCNWQGIVHDLIPSEK